MNHEQMLERLNSHLELLTAEMTSYEHIQLETRLVEAILKLENVVNLNRLAAAQNKMRRSMPEPQPPPVFF